MTQYLLRFNYTEDYASSFSTAHRDAARRWQNQSTSTQAAGLSQLKLYCCQLDHSTLSFESAAARTLALIYLLDQGCSVSVIEASV
jgi:hypothetical protein